MSIALSTIIFFFASRTLTFPIEFARPVSLLTIIYHIAILLFSYCHRNSLDSSHYLISRPSIRLAAFLLIAWLITVGFTIAILVVFGEPRPWIPFYRVSMWTQLVLALIETGIMMSIVRVCKIARKSIGGAESDGRIQI
jgi:hypothetical protein